MNCARAAAEKYCPLVRGAAAERKVKVGRGARRARREARVVETLPNRGNVTQYGSLDTIPT